MLARYSPFFENFRFDIEALCAGKEVSIRAVVVFQQSGQKNVSYLPLANHYSALCYGGRAKLALDAGRLEDAVNAVLAGAAAEKRAFTIADGLGNTMKRTVRRLRRRLRKIPALLLRLDSGLKLTGVAGGE